MQGFNNQSMFVIIMMLLPHQYQHQYHNTVNGLLLSIPSTRTCYNFNNNKLNQRFSNDRSHAIGHDHHRVTQLNAIQNKDDDNNNNNNGIRSSLPKAEAIEEFFETPIIEISLILLVLLSSLLAAINTIPYQSIDYINMNNMAQEVITVLFAIEFILRWFAADLKSSYFVQPLTLIDIVVVIIPLALKILPAAFGLTFLPELSNKSGLINRK